MPPRRKLILGPILRYAGESDATVWVETDAACEVAVAAAGSDHRSRTFSVEGHHYALVRITGLEPGNVYEYTVALDGEEVWPEGDFPPSVIRTPGSDGELVLAFGSCRVAAPHEPPYTKKRSTFGHRYERDALYALACRMLREPHEAWPDALLMLGDQIYADEVSAGTRRFISSRRDGSDEEAPEDEVKDFEEYTRLYRDAWGDPVVRWLLSTVPSAMIFDDHDVNDDWNTSEAWVRQMRAKPWWQERIIGAFASYWVYQHSGNLSPRELENDPIFERVREVGDATQILREFARRADREAGSSRWSFHRDFGRVRLIVMDSRAGRVLEEGNRSMIDDAEWAWIEEKSTGDFDHLLLGTSIPFLLSPGLHHLEAWNEAVCKGAWGKRASWVGEGIRQLVDLEHWPAFHKSFDALTDLLRSVSAGERSTGREAPASVVVLSGDVHHGYLAEVGFKNDGDVKSPVYQSVSSPMRNPLGLPERLALRAGWTKTGEIIGKTLARLANAEEPNVNWRLTYQKPWFSNHVSTLKLHGRQATLVVERTTPEDTGEPRLHRILKQRLS